MLTFDTLFITVPIPATEIVRQAARNIAKQILIFTYVYINLELFKNVSFGQCFFQLDLYIFEYKRNKVF